MENALTERQTKLPRKLPLSRTFLDVDKSGVDESSKVEAPKAVRSNAETIAAGIDFVFSRLQDEHWSELASDAAPPDQWVTAYILGRLGDLPSNQFSPSQFKKIDQALEWLMQARTPDAVWGCASRTTPDADATAWAMIALRSHGKAVPAAATSWLQSCRRPDGGFAAHPGDCTAACCKNNLATITAVAAKALGELDSRTERHLESWLRLAPASGPATLAASFYACSEVLDCDAALAPWSLLNRVCHLTVLSTPSHPFEIALLLRSLLRMRMRTSWSVAEKLRALQKADGSWPGSPILGPTLPGVGVREDLLIDGSGLLATATAISALWMAEARPRLSFGSDLPRPRRLPES
jgi:hypothetical protein